MKGNPMRIKRLISALEDMLPYAQSRYEDLAEAKEDGGEDEDCEGAFDAQLKLTRANAILAEAKQALAEASIL